MTLDGTVDQRSLEAWVYLMTATWIRNIHTLFKIMVMLIKLISLVTPSFGIFFERYLEHRSNAEKNNQVQIWSGEWPTSQLSTCHFLLCVPWLKENSFLQYYWFFIRSDSVKISWFSVDRVFHFYSHTIICTALSRAFADSVFMLLYPAVSEVELSLRWKALWEKY